jgi:hypothetical protein
MRWNGIKVFPEAAVAAIEHFGSQRRLLISKGISSFIDGVSLNDESAPSDKGWRKRMVTLYDGFRSDAVFRIRRVKNRSRGRADE